MPIEPPLPPADPLVDSVAGEFSRVLRDAVGRLRDEHARTLESALEDARAEAERARDLVVEEALADARVEFEQQRQHMADQHAAALRDLEASLRTEADTVLTSRLRDAEARLREEFGAETRAAVADAEQRVRAEGEQALALATSEVEARLRGDADAALRLAQEAFERRLSDTPPPAPVVAAPLVARAFDETPPAASEREVRLASLERMLLSIERLDAAPSLRAALDALAEAVAAEAPRSAVWVVRGDRLKGWRASAEYAPADFANTDVHLADAGPLARAVSSATAQPIKASALSVERDGALAWLGLDVEQAGLAVPVTVDGRVVALVYADDGASAEREVPGSWPEAIQVLARHAARVLEVLTARRASGPGRQAGNGAVLPAPNGMSADEARRFAQLVVAEIKPFQELDARSGRDPDDSRTRLAQPIARARRLFDERVPASVSSRDEIFEDELNRALAGGDARQLDARDGATA